MKTSLTIFLIVLALGLKGQYFLNQEFEGTEYAADVSLLEGLLKLNLDSLGSTIVNLQERYVAANDNTGLAISYHFGAWVDYLNYDFIGAAENAKSAYSFSQNSGNDNLITRTKLFWAFLEAKNDKFDKASKLAQELLLDLDPQKEASKKAMCLVIFSIVKYSQRDMEACQQYMADALKLAKEGTDEFLNKELDYENAVMWGRYQDYIYNETEDWQKALDYTAQIVGYFDQIIAYNRTQNDIVREILNSVQRGFPFAYSQMFEEYWACLHVADSLSLVHKTCRQRVLVGLVSYHDNRAEARKTIQESNKLLPYLEKANMLNRLSSQHNLRHYNFEILTNEATQIDSVKYYAQKSFEALRKSLDYKKKVFENAGLDAAQEFEVIYQTKEKEANLKEEKLRNENLVLQLWGLVVLIALIVLSFVLLLKWRKQKQLLENQRLERERILAEQRVDDLLKEAQIVSIEALLEGQEEERVRIARELHDNVGALLSTVRINFDVLGGKMKVEETDQHEMYATALERLDDAVFLVRDVSHKMSRGLVSQYGLKTSLDRLVELVRQAGKVKINCNLSGDLDSETPKIQSELYKITQEIVGNSLKHSGANKIEIQIIKREDAISLMVEDNGKGFNLEKVVVENSLGLKSLRSRALELGGEMEFDSGKGSGTTITVEIPIAEKV